MDSKTLALQAIAHMEVNEQTNWREVALLCITIAHVELDPDFDAMLKTINAAIDAA